MDNKGIGPISSVDLGDGIDSQLAGHGKEVFGNLCTACHKMDKKFVGPAITGVTERRSPEWIMNMILNPEEMIKKDPIAKRLLVENNMAVMANQNVSEEDARAILEYFREIDNQ
jgi:putative heme-binding domain-containing protein